MTQESDNEDSIDKLKTKCNNSICKLEKERNRYKLLLGVFIVVAIILIGFLLSLYKSNISSPTLLAVAIIVSMIAGLSFWGSQKREWYLHPLGLPSGSIRAIIALLFVMTILLAANNFQQESKVSASGSKTSSLPDWLMGIVGTIIGFYFGERSSENNEKNNKSFDVIAKLEMLEELKKNGTIDEKNFIAQREKLLSTDR